MPKADPILDRCLASALKAVADTGDPNQLPAPLRITVLVHAAQGTIDNGGLRDFFEADFPGRPPYSAFVEAYRAIGAAADADTLASSVGLFPFADPHLHCQRRDAFMSSFDDDGDDEDHLGEDPPADTPPDDPFAPYTDQLCGDASVWRRLGEYVRVHAAVFREVE